MTQIDMATVSVLLKDPRIIRMVSILDIASLSILELLEYEISRSDINHALANGVIEIDKSTLPAAEESSSHSSAENMLVAGDLYFKFLNSKVRLTELGRYILSSLRGEEQEWEVLDKARQMVGPETFSPPDFQHGPG
ncbi:MAG: hypothetical protein ABI361_08040 [Nitrososphaera sp.]|jgi:hypothetical protein